MKFEKKGSTVAKMCCLVQRAIFIENYNTTSPILLDTVPINTPRKEQEAYLKLNHNDLEVQYYYEISTSSSFTCTNRKTTHNPIHLQLFQEPSITQVK